MKKNIRSKISSFLTSEEGRVSTKAPLTLGVATGSVLLAQTMIPSPAQAEIVWDIDIQCDDDADCADDEFCDSFFGIFDPGPTIVIHTWCADLPDD